MAQVTNMDRLREIYGAPNARAIAKELRALDPHCRRFLELSPFMMLASSDGTRLDVSPKGDAPGSWHVLDDKTLLIPDWPGNRRIDGLRNILLHPQVGLIFLIPNVKETLRINGRATIHDDPQLLALFETRGKQPITVIKVEIQEVFLHCAKSLMRSQLWLPESWPERDELPTMGEMIRDHAILDTPAETQEDMEKRYEAALY